MTKRSSHKRLMREGLRKILREYENPPPGGTLVPREWVEANLLRPSWAQRSPGPTAGASALLPTERPQ